MLVRLLTLFLAAVGLAACGQDPRDAEPVQLDPGASAQTTRTVERALDRFRASGAGVPGLTVPGATAALRAPSLGAVGGASGVRSLRSPARLRPDARVHIGSITKTFTAAWIMVLDQEGSLSLSDPISRYLDYPGGGRVTIRQLLGHTSGLPDLADPEVDLAGLLERDPGLSPRELVAAIGRRGKPHFRPGRDWEYNNAGYIMLGLIGEKASGRRWAEEITRRFIEPLGLERTTIFTGGRPPATATGYELSCEGDACGGKRPELEPVSNAPDWALSWSAGAIVSDASDVARWFEALVAGDVLDARHRRLMQTPTPQSLERAERLDSTAGFAGTDLVRGYGLGVARLEVEGVGEAFGHIGSISGYQSLAGHFPERDLTVATSATMRPATVEDAFRRVAKAAAVR